MSRVPTALVLVAALASGPPLLAGVEEKGGKKAGREEAVEYLPRPLPERPFLLLDAPRRFLPSQRAWVRLQLRGGGRAQVALFRVLDPARQLAVPGAFKQGVTVARSRLGAEMEALLGQRASLPKTRGEALLSLVKRRWAVASTTRRPRRIKEEAEVYDSNETEESVATYWVRRNGWGVVNVDLGRLPKGLYMVRAHRGPWAATAYLSVGELVLLVRRGDHHDLALVTDGDGQPLAGVAVEVRARSKPGSSKVVTSRRVSRHLTGRDGTVRFPASDRVLLRVIASRGADVAWADVTHARLSPCDPRVYLATGRPVYRLKETIFLRGHVRGCTRAGFSPLAGERVRLRPAPRSRKDGVLTVKTDAHGDFTAELTADSRGIVASLRGRDHVRDLQIDHRVLPRRQLFVSLDRTWAAAGQLVNVTVADAQGGWPSKCEVVLRTPAGEQRRRIGPGRPARFVFRVPQRVPTLKSVELQATVLHDRRSTTSSAQLWIGSRPEVLHLQAGRTWASSGEAVPFQLDATSLVGSPVSGAAGLILRRSDGNRPRGPVLWRSRVELRSGKVRGLIILRGAGPWWVEARRGEASSTLIIWDRPRPPSLSAGGPLAVRPRRLLVSPGGRLALDVRLPGGRGRAWVTLEQGSVWSTVMVRGRGTVPAELKVPSRARGVAAVLVTHIARGKVQTTSAAVEIATSKRVHLSMKTDQRVYAEGARARVTLQARDMAGRGRDGVVSLWLADAGYWELGEDRYPLPTDFFTLPGRMASAADSSLPVAFGAEEGRRGEALMRYNGAAVPGTSFRHGWGHITALIDLHARGSLKAVAGKLARAAGLNGAWVCPQAVRKAGQISLAARFLPWDLVAVKVAEKTGTTAMVRRRVLLFSCSGGGGAGRAGNGSGMGGLGTRSAGALLGGVREQYLEGSLLFIGKRRLGPDGKLVLEVKLPDHPGRWRVEALTIAGDGGGGRAHAVVHTVKALTISVDLPGQLRPGDTAKGAIRVHAPWLKGKVVNLEVKLPATLEPLMRTPRTLTLDVQGTAALPVTVRALRPGAGVMVVRARHDRAADAVKLPIRVLSNAASRPLNLTSVVGPSAAELRLHIPPLVKPATLRVSLETDPSRNLHEVHQLLLRPRWNLPALALDHLASLRALARAGSRLIKRLRPAYRSAEIQVIQHELGREIKGQLARLEQMQAPDGALSWWSGMKSDSQLTALALIHAGGGRPSRSWRTAMNDLRRRAKKGKLPPRSTGPAAYLLASRDAEDKDLALSLLQRHRAQHHGDLDRMIWNLRAAHELASSHSVARALKQDLAARLASRVKVLIRKPARGSCAGPLWFLCFAREGREGQIARAALALLHVAHPGARELALEAAISLATRPSDPWWFWGTAEADIVELQAQLISLSPQRPGAGGDQLSVLLGRQTILSGALTAPRQVTIPHGGELRLRLPAKKGRLAWLRVQGDLTVKPPLKDQGPAGLNRRLSRTPSGSGWVADLSFVLRRRADQVMVGLPLPAGLDLAGPLTSPRTVELSGTPGWQGWSDVGLLRQPRRPVISLEDGVLLARLPRPRAGNFRLRVHLVERGKGTFSWPGAWLRADSGQVWGLTPSSRVEVGK